jgi:tetratricopeptide (TPR) repeat protein
MMVLTKNIKILRVYFLMPVILLCLSIFRCSGQKYTISDSTYVLKRLNDANAFLSPNPDKCLRETDSFLVISRAIGYPRGTAVGLKIKGQLKADAGNMNQAKIYFDSALAVCDMYHLNKTKAAISQAMGNMYSQKGDYNKAFEYYEQSLKTRQLLHDTDNMASCYNSMATTLGQMNYYQDAFKYFFIALDLYRLKKDSTNVAFIYVNLSTAYRNLKNYKEEYKYLSASNRIYASLRDSASLKYNYNQMGDYYKSTGNNDSALFFYLKALSFYREIKEYEGLSDVLNEIGDIYISEKDYQRAGRYFKESLDIATGIANRFRIYSAERHLADAYEGMGDHQKAYQYLLQSDKLHDSLLGKEQQDKLAELTTRFGVKETEAKNALLQKETHVQKLKLRQKNILTGGAFAALFGFFIVALLLFRQSKLRANQLKTELEQKQLRAQMNPHFIFNCLNSIQHFVVANDVKNANKYLSGFASLMRQTLENSKETTIALRKEIEYLENYLTLESMRFEHGFDFEISCAENLNTDALEIPPMIIQPFIENAIRHGLRYLENKRGKLKIEFYQVGNHLVCRVDDNGIGREESQKIKMSSAVVYESQGMELTRQRLALVSRSSGADYKIEIDDKRNRQGEPDGTTVIINFPLT